MSNQARGCCSCSCLISITISTIFIWLAFRILTPTLTIEQFDLFTLQNPNPPTNNNNTLHYNLKLKNRNFNKGIYYDALNITFYSNHTFPIGNATIDPFYQGYWKSTHRVGDIATNNIGGNVNSDVVYRVELETLVRYKGPLWKTKRRSLFVGGDLKVNGQGSLIKSKGNNGIKLRSSCGKSMGSFGVKGILGVLFFIYLLI